MSTQHGVYLPHSIYLLLQQRTDLPRSTYLLLQQRSICHIVPTYSRRIAPLPTTATKVYLTKLHLPTIATKVYLSAYYLPTLATKVYPSHSTFTHYSDKSLPDETAPSYYCNKTLPEALHLPTYHRSKDLPDEEHRPTNATKSYLLPGIQAGRYKAGTTGCCKTTKISRYLLPGI